ncbi:MAG: hypothetical protein R3293_12705 [Candidatus Promineifilaceae bacterium]|nr:hypothetical protein [Candidatus Promineifilaceae bacterium]
MSEELQKIKDDEKEKMNAASSVNRETAPTEPEDTGGNQGWIAGVAIIAVGVVFLVSNLTGFYLNNWWALFILIPGLYSFVKAWNIRKEAGHWSKSARGSLIGGLAITLVAVIFLFGLDWGRIWPLFLILGGIAILLGGWFDS